MHFIEMCKWDFISMFRNYWRFRTYVAKYVNTCILKKSLYSLWKKYYFLMELTLVKICSQYVYLFTSHFHVFYPFLFLSPLISYK